MAKPTKHTDLNKPWADTRGKRSRPSKSERRFFLIICEGIETEKNYFEAMRSDLPKGILKIRVVHSKRPTMGLVVRAEAELRRIQRTQTVDHVWLVFDRDSFNANEFNGAVRASRDNGYHAAWSNECFELWFLLHFEAVNSRRSRGELKVQLSRQLKKHFGKTYEKNDAEMYQNLKNLRTVALDRAKKLCDYHPSNRAPSDANPCTYVHELVGELLEMTKS